MLTLYDTTIPVLQRYLRQVDGMLAIAQRHAGSGGIDGAPWLAARLSPTMRPLHDQVCIAANFAFRIGAPLAGLPLPPYPQVPATFDAMRHRVAEAIHFVDSLSPRAMDGAESLLVTDIAGDAEVHLSGIRFAHEYALPNFFFHVCMVYAILRREGVPLGKTDFDGFHLYR
jgi:uncharacterized protein